MNSKRLIRFDWAMKHLLRKKANYDIVEGFLRALLEDDNLKVIEILESESNKEDRDDKFNRVDVLVKDNKDRKIIIEIQNSREADYLYRILYGVSKSISQSIEAGQSYKDISKVISVNILYFNLGIGEDYLYYGSTEFVGINNHERISKDNEILRNIIPQGTKYNPVEIYPEYYLIQVEKYQNIVNRAIDEWIYWFKNEEVKDDSISLIMNKVKDELSILKMPQKERVAYEKYLEKLAAEENILETAYEDGRKEMQKELMSQIKQAKQREEQAKRKLAQKMKKYGENIEEIINETGLTREEIEKL